MNRINWDDEINLSARERGHTYGPFDIIYAHFDTEEDVYQNTYKGVVQFRTSNVGSGYFEADGNTLQTYWSLVAWRPATEAEIDAFEAWEPSCDNCGGPGASECSFPVDVINDEQGIVYVEETAMICGNCLE